MSGETITVSKTALYQVLRALTGKAYIGCWPYREHQNGLIYSAIVWTRKRRYTKP